MKYKVFKIIFIILIVILFSLATFFLIKGLLMEKEDKGKSDSAPSVSSVDVEKAISAIKSEHGELLYESEDIPEFTSLAFKENDRIESYIIDTSTGEELKLEDIIKNNKMDDFLKKEMELLNLKYLLVKISV